jgi:hypothetical protein
MRRRIRVLTFLTILFFALPTAVWAIDFGGISARPANPTAADERTSAWFIYTLTPGGAANDALVVQNDTGKKIMLDLYPADSAPSTGGGFALKQKIEKMTGVGSWIALKAYSIKLAPRQKITVPFHLALPEKIAPGLYAGGIILAENTPPNNAGGVSINTRIGIRVYVTVVPATMAAARPLASASSPLLTFLTATALFIALSLLAVLYMLILHKRKNAVSPNWLSTWKEMRHRIKKP